LIFMALPLARQLRRSWDLAQVPSSLIAHMKGVFG